MPASRPGPRVLDLGVDELAQPLAQVEGRHRELFEPVGRRGARHVVEELGRVAAQGPVAREERDVGVDPGGDRVVVAGAEMGVGAKAVPLPPHHQGHLGVGLQPHESVHHVDPGALEISGPAEVPLLVETCLELHEGGDRLAGVRRRRERGHDGGVLARAVQGLLDGDHVRVGRRLAQELDHHVELLVRVVDDELALANRREAVAVGVADPPGGARGERGEEQVGARVEHELARVGKSEQALARDEVPGSDPDLVHQEVLQVLRDVQVHGEPDDVPPAPLPEQALELPDEVLRLLLDLHVAVAKHPAHARVLDPESREQSIDERANDLLDGDEAFRVARQLDEPRDPLGDRDEPEHWILRIADASHHEAEAEVGDEREWVRRVARDGGEDREHLAHEVLVEPGPVPIVELGLVENEDPRLAHLDHQRFPATLLVVHQRMGTDRDRGKLLGPGSCRPDWRP